MFITKTFSAVRLSFKCLTLRSFNLYRSTGVYPPLKADHKGRATIKTLCFAPPDCSGFAFIVLFVVLYEMFNFLVSR